MQPKMYAKADLDCLKSELCSFVEDYLKNNDEQTVEENWMDLKQCLFTVMDKYVPN